MEPTKLNPAERKRLEEFIAALGISLQRIAAEQHDAQSNNQNIDPKNEKGDSHHD